MLFKAVKSYCVTTTRRTTREAASLSNRLLPAEAGKKSSAFSSLAGRQSLQQMSQPILDFNEIEAQED